jgi:hypothetical protein
MTDSTTAKGWMKKMNFSKAGNDPIQALTHINAARKYAQVFLDVDVKGYNKNLTSILRSLFPNQMQNHFKILQISSKISCWLISLLQQLPVSERLREEHTMAKAEHGNVGQHTASPLDAQNFS